MDARHYKSAQSFKQALDSRLREAAQEGADLIHIRQSLVFQRFLARVFMTFGDAAVLKGGVTMEMRISNARATRDIDLQVAMEPSTAINIFQQIGSLDMNDYLRYEVREIRPILAGLGVSEQGIRLQARPILAGKPYGDAFGVDVVFSNHSLAKADIAPGTDYLSFAGITPPVLRLYPVELHIAEKLHAYTRPRPAENSRIKDLPDIASLAGVKDLHRHDLAAAFRLIFESRNTHLMPVSLPEPPVSWLEPYCVMANSNRLKWKDLSTLFHAVSSFINPVLLQPDQASVWSHESSIWG